VLVGFGVCRYLSRNRSAVGLTVCRNPFVVRFGLGCFLRLVFGVCFLICGVVRRNLFDVRLVVRRVIRFHFGLFLALCVALAAIARAY
jgi:hypothetical protein